ncbi:hypothetical protein Q4I28_007658 [Leishmania naiffi]|uniref:Proteophosphoglycan ppg4 n=1 Tax=Leishmania naiffi TaxID=5678 RepID=A0AAW3B6V9_9TRYP
MNSAATPVLKLQPRSINTTHGSVPGAKSVSSSSSKVRTRSIRVTSTQCSEVRPRGATMTSVLSVTRRTIRKVKPVSQDQPHVALVEASEQQTRSSAPMSLLSIFTKKSCIGDSVMAPPSAGVASKMSVHCVKPSSGATVATPSVVLPNRSASRADSTCGSLRGRSNRGFADLRQLPPTVPRVGQLSSNVPLMRSATVMTTSIRRTSSLTTIIPTASAPGSQLCSRTPSVHEVAVPLSPRRAPLPVRPYTSAAASRVNSVNSRLAEGIAHPMRQPSQCPHISSVRPVTKRSNSSASTTGPTRTTSPIAPLSNGVAMTADDGMRAPSAALGMPPRSMGVRPLVGTNHVSAPKSGGVTDASRLRTLHPSFQSTLRADRGTRSARGGARSGSSGNAASCTSARRASHQTPVRQHQHQQPLSARCAASASPSRKVTRKLGSDSASVAVAPAPSAPFQKTHTGYTPLLSFAGIVQGPGVSAVSRGPVSPIRRTSTACPSAAQHYPAASAENPARASRGLASPNTDAAFANPWIRPSMLSTPTNRGGARDASEAPTLPYEGSTGQRGSLSLSPRTDFDAFSVSGRLSYGV